MAGNLRYVKRRILSALFFIYRTPFMLGGTIMGYLDKDGLSRAFTKLKTLIDGKADVGHTHSYAGSSSSGGAATSANKLNTNAGSGTQPVYFANGVPVACTSYGNASVEYAISSGSANSATYATSSGSATTATKATGIAVSDTRNDNSAPASAAFDKNMLTADFKIGDKIGSPAGFNGTYCGVLSLAPWSETSGGHGYQLAFGYAKEGHPRLALRGSDLSATSWDSWYKVYTSDDKPTPSEIGAANASHTHTKSQITDFPTSMPASDVYSWAKQSSKPSYSKSEVGLGNVDNTADAAKSVKYAASAGSAGSVAWSNVSGKPTSMPASDVYSWAKASSKPSYSANEVGAVPTSRTVNGKALSSNITLSAGDVGAAASSHSHNYAGSSSAGGSANWANGADYANYAFSNNGVSTSGSGSAYTATVSGFSLATGKSIVMIPNVTSTTTTPTLNVSGTGAKNIRMRLSSSTSSTIPLIRANFLTQYKPVKVTYDGTYWVIDDFIQPDANNLYGTLISRGSSAPSSGTAGFIYIQTT